jgi:pimeloyl-ACP methyl ester carboxylesterase
MRQMERADVEGLALAYELRGSGDPVVLVHWGVSAVWAEPLLDEPAIADRHRVLTYHRAGFGDSSRLDGTPSLADHARHCRLLIRELGIEQAHFVGHSSSANVVLQLALDFPDAVRTLTLMEAARPTPQTAVQAEFLHGFVEPAVARYREGDRAGAVDTFFRGVFGPDYRGPLEDGLPGAFEQAVADADAFFRQELPALQQWRFTQEEARRIVQPVLLMLGGRSAPTFSERRELLLSWLPNAELSDVPAATHLLHAVQPAATAAELAAFWDRHPMAM